MTKKEKCARAWIHKKIKSGVKQAELRDSVGLFSNRKKEETMKMKKMTSKQYDRRYSFLEEVFFLLTYEDFK